MVIILHVYIYFTFIAYIYGTKSSPVYRGDPNFFAVSLLGHIKKISW